MQPKLNDVELGYALAVLDSIGGIRSAVESEYLENKFATKIINWLIKNELLVYGILSVKDEKRGSYLTRGRRAIDFYCSGGEFIPEKIKHLRQINEEAK